MMALSTSAWLVSLALTAPATSTPATPAPATPAPATPAPTAAPTAAPSAAPTGMTRPRPVPDYDGRPPPGVDATDALLLVPRVALYPAHLVLEYGLRRPLVGLVTVSEKHHVAERVIGVFTFDDGRAGVFPTFALRSDMKPLVGLSLFANSAGHSDHDLRLRAGGWDRTAVWAAGEDRWRIFEDRSGVLSLAARFRRTNDNAYYGLGPDTREDYRFYYLSNVLDAGAQLDARLEGLSRYRVLLQARRARFGGSDYGDDDDDDDDDGAGSDGRNIEAVPGSTREAFAPGFQDGYRLLRAGLELDLDSRHPSRPDYPGSGVRLETSGVVSIDPGNHQRSFATWGAGLAAILDLTGYEHLLALQLTAAFVERMGDHPIPFYERVTLGGPERLQGFRDGRFRDDSALSAGLHYRYPVWLYADAELISSVGNVFPDHLRGFRFQRLYWSNGLSLKSNFSRETAVGLTAAIGSTRFDATDFSLADSVRLFFGVGQGF
jgi:hypothetical protein